MASPIRQNITFSLSKAVIRTAKIEAAKRGTSVNTLVEEYLASLGNEERRRAAAAKRMLEIMENAHPELPAKRWSREELHER